MHQRRRTVVLWRRTRRFGRFFDGSACARLTSALGDRFATAHVSAAARRLLPG